mmetsp:Transcript_64842/g.186319  ORF Transcript_64842/g.186319 Transcript_64842/m.186319 type:complete len:267 (-) Transcript_64842:185-985(-)
MATPDTGTSVGLTKVGLLTGLSYVSGVDYYKGINEQASALLPKGKHMKPNPPMVLVSLDCDQYVAYLEARDDAGVAEYLFAGVETLHAANVDFVVICSNTAHCVVPMVRQRLPSLPLLHIADCSASACKERGITTVGLLGTEPTMRDGSWLKSRLGEHGLTVIVPTEQASQRRCYDIICQELSFDIYKDESRDFLLVLVAEMQALGCQGVILGCTELELLLTREHEGRAALPLFRSAAVHITAAARVLAGAAALDDFSPSIGTSSS